ncbi:hypothetical protein [Bacillus sp. LL01]|uniref:hypothetical protein n=1 Tax=Bacillus sp. LL01 TaxID=1665556 RepID=UPI0012FEFF36|nr:hypothetical protein [Bacillus sp. LL01]
MRLSSYLFTCVEDEEDTNGTLYMVLLGKHHEDIEGEYSLIHSLNGLVTSIMV